ncbi:cupin domain-containing protein, partial [Acidithiobacillus ferrivorans]|uniref:cupin domain-containing protein n=1 Tax=Acidithiobacillus ferrivorans TaxID=160808 RepID=UPI00114768FA
VVPGDFGWSDIGSWTSFGALLAADSSGNQVLGESVLEDAQNCIVHSADRLTALLGVEELIVVDTPDALLIARKDRDQDVKRIVAELKRRGHQTHNLHRTVHRPWGTYTVLEEGSRFKIKRILVKPGAALSLQMHHHRSEHWIVVSGTAKIVNGGEDRLVHTNESTYIPAGTPHRLINPGVIDLVMIEVQSGEYLGEDDIVRFEDRYGRVPV